jgi:hypothetical protein
MSKEQSHEKIGLIPEFDLSFWHFKSCKGYLFIEKNRQQWLYVDCTDTIEKIYQFTRLEKIKELLINNKERDFFKMVNVDFNNNCEDQVLSGKSSLYNMKSDNSINFESEFVAMEENELDRSVITEEHLKVFDIESEIKTEENSLLQSSSLELVTILLLIIFKKIFSLQLLIRFFTGDFNASQKAASC